MPISGYYNQPEEGFSFTKPVSSQKEKFVWQLVFLRVGILFSVAVIFITLINLQIVNGERLKKQSDDNRIYVEPIIAPRGIIYDRNGIPLAYNQDTFSLVLDQNIFDRKDSSVIFTALSSLLKIPASRFMDAYKKGTVAQEALIKLADNLTKDEMIEIQTNPMYKGVRIEPSTIRVYPFKDALAQVLGYISSAGVEDLKRNQDLTSTDEIGKDGIEQEYDKQLRGVDGENIVEVNTSGKVVSIIQTQDPIPGDNIVLSINSTLQEKASEFLVNGITKSSATGGAFIIEDVTDGSILAMVSSPSYDNNKFSGGISEKDYEDIINNANKPLLNRAVSEAQPPGSILKTITASAALQQGAIDENTQFFSGGTFEYGGHEFQDFGKIVRGNLNVVGGLEWSSNIFFYNTILKLGINGLITYEKYYGLGSATGIDLPGEVTGEISSPQIKQELTGQVWYGGDSLNAAIGQGYTEVTPIQIVNWITCIANGGELFAPRLIGKVESTTNQLVSSFGPDIVKQGFVSSKNLDLIKQGMHAAVTDGIDKNLLTQIVDIAGKTGTAEFGALDANGQYTHEHAWASGFAPYSNPQIAFISFLEGGGLSSNAEFVARNVLNWYYGDYLKSNQGKL